VWASELRYQFSLQRNKNLRQVFKFERCAQDLRGPGVTPFFVIYNQKEHL